MKKNLFFAALAITALVSCSESDYLGDEKQVPVSSSDVGAISFGTGFKAVTRAATGADAADSLNHNFVVEGIKTVKKSDQSNDSIVEVFDNYNVNWFENTADKTLSNTSNWEYVGQAIIGGSKTNVREQSIKYWDFAASKYDFWAYSLGGGSAEVISLAHDAILGTSAYTITGTKADLAKVYISDLQTAYAASEGVAGKPVMGDEVTLTFRSLVTKVRVGLYETIPGYSVKSVKFYTVADDANPTTTATLYASSAVLPSFPTSGDAKSTYTVTFPKTGKGNVADSDYNKAHVTFPNDGSKVTTVAFGELSYGEAHKYEKSTGNIWLRINSAQPTWAVETGAEIGAYSIVMPNETGAVLTLKVDYTLESTDGTGETITVHGATALVPSQYTQWKPNYAYTYLFKISDNTNGLTNKTVTNKVGLYPITLNAVVVDTENFTQETITTVATPSITTYSISSNVTENNEYLSTDSIYVMATNTENSATINMAGNATLYHIEKMKSDGTYGEYAATEAEVLDALTTYYSNESNTYEGRDSIRLTQVTNGFDLSVTEIPLADGNKITGLTAGDVAKINKNTMLAGKNYAFVLNTTTGSASTTDKYEAKTLGTGDTKTNYYVRSGEEGSYTYTKALGSEPEGTIYYEKYTTSNATYGIKVIKIKAN